MQSLDSSGNPHAVALEQSLPAADTSDDASTAVPSATSDHLEQQSHVPEDALDFQTCTIRVRCSSCGMELYASAPKLTAIGLADHGMPALLAVERDSRHTLVQKSENLERCPNCHEARLYDDGIVSVTIDVVEMYNLRVSGSVPTLCIDCREAMCDFSGNFLASIHIPPQSGDAFDLSGVSSIDTRKLAGCRGSLILVTDGGDDDVIMWALHVSRMLRKQFQNLRPSRYLSGGISAFKRVFPGLFSPPITISLPACVLSHNHSGSSTRSLSLDPRRTTTTSALSNVSRVPVTSAPTSLTLFEVSL